MTTTTNTPARYAPPGSVLVRDKWSDAVAYLYDRETNGRRFFFAMSYCGRRSRPDSVYRYTSLEKRAAAVTEYFAARQAHKARIKSGAQPRRLKVGDILYTSWGYDQTNVDFYQVIGLVGNASVDIRQIKAVKDGPDGIYYRLMPVPDQFIGTVMWCKRVSPYDGKSVKIDRQTAYLWDGRSVQAGGCH